MQPPSRNNNNNSNNGFPDWEEEEEQRSFMRNRAQSISASARFPSSSQDVSHFATLQRPNKRGGFNGAGAPEAPPPLPPRSFPSQPQLSFQSRSEEHTSEL